jgi:hypothetical protein
MTEPSILAAGATSSRKLPDNRMRQTALRTGRLQCTRTRKNTTVPRHPSIGPCQRLAQQIDLNLPEADNKVWHAHPVWFLDGNPVVGYSKLKGRVRLVFWSGQSFEEEGLEMEGSFKAAEVRYTAADQIDTKKLQRWLAEAPDIQWDYKNLIRRKGRLERSTQRSSVHVD